MAIHQMNVEKHILLIEPFYGGSHKQLVDVLERNFCPNCDKFCMSGKKWHWRMRTSGLHFAMTIPRNHNYRYLFTSANLNLAELVGLRPDLNNLKKILYFHENQLVYPVRKKQDRDFQYGYNQIVSCLSADIILFNSAFNMDSFLSSLKPFFNVMPDYKPDESITQQIQSKCKVLYFPIILSEIGLRAGTQTTKSGPLHIVWAHRWGECTFASHLGSAIWGSTTTAFSHKEVSVISYGMGNTCERCKEHDKDPRTFFDVLYLLKEEQLDFRVSVMGQGYTDVPDIFGKAKEDFKEQIITWGYQETKEDFFKTLKSADVAVSTAVHEFFGVSMLEAVSCGCYPLCPKRLVYPEIFPDEYLYNTKNQLLKRLRQFCKRPEVPRQQQLKVDMEKFSWKEIKKCYETLFQN